MKTVGIICAMEKEIDAIRNNLEKVKQEVHGGMNFWVGNLSGKQVVAALSGVGKALASMCTEAMIITYNPDVIFNCGVAGGMDKRLRIGDIAVADRVCQHDLDTTPLGEPAGWIGELNKVYIDTDKSLAEKLCRFIKSKEKMAYIGTIASGDQFIKGSVREDFVAGHFMPIACEMEGAAVGLVCTVNNVSFAVIRGITDIYEPEEYRENVIEVANSTAHMLIDFIKEM